METKENWIEKVLNATNEMTHVSPSEDLLDRINIKINTTKVFSMPTLWLIAASIILLISINIFIINNQNQSKKNQTNSFESYLNQSNQLYN